MMSPADLFPTLTALRQWSDRWLFGADHQPQPLPTRFGEDIAPMVVTTPSGRIVTAGDRII